MARVISELRCLRCGYKWFPRGPKQPAHCPNPRCNSPYWNRSRLRKKTTPASISQAKKLRRDFRPRRPVTPVMVQRVESPEMDWLEENAEELGRYPGEWLLIQGRRLVLHSRDFDELRIAIREHGIDSPFVYYVPTDEEANFIAI